MTFTRALCYLADGSSIKLAKVILGTDFVAGLCTETFRWLVVPQTSFSEVKFESRINELDYPVNFSQLTLSQYLGSLTDAQIQLNFDFGNARFLLNQMHGCFALATQLAGNGFLSRATTAIKLSSVSRIEVIAVDNFHAEVTDSAKV